MNRRLSIGLLIVAGTSLTALGACSGVVDSDPVAAGAGGAHTGGDGAGGSTDGKGGGGGKAGKGGSAGDAIGGASGECGVAGEGGSAGDATGGAGGTSTPICEYSYDEPCNGCFQDKCRGACMKCVNDTECHALGECLLEASDDEMIDQCLLDHDSGVDDFLALFGNDGCLGEKCAVECPF